MADIVERLRDWQNHKVPIEYLREAANEIERLREALADANRVIHGGDAPPPQKGS